MELKQLYTGQVRWTKLRERDGVEIEDMKIIPPGLVGYIPKLVADLKITVDLNQCNKLNELAALLINLPDWFDQARVSLELIDKPNNSNDEVMSMDEFSEEIALHRNSLVLKQLDYRGFGDG